MDIIQLFKDRGIEYIESGPNVKKGCINIKCPFCGEADPSKHLGIELDTGKWACWRNIDHRGKKIPRLLQALLSCSYEAAQNLVLEHTPFSSIINRLQPKPVQPIIHKERISKERGLVSLIDVTPEDMPLYQRFWDYLTKRGFEFKDAVLVAIDYELYCALTGRFKNRIVFPIFINHKIVGYTGRCVDNGSLRYLSHPGTVVKQNILWYDKLKGSKGQRLFICEGPFDALKLDYGLQKIGSMDRATCLFGVSHTVEQLKLIYSLQSQFEEFVILFDQDAFSSALGLVTRLANLQVRVGFLPTGVLDPGALTFAQIETL